MGGRGSNFPGGSSGVHVVTDSDGKEIGTITVKRGRAFFESSTTGEINELPGTPQEAIKRAGSNGASTRKLSGKEVKNREVAHKADRDQANKTLDKAYVSDEHFVDGSRASRIGNRAAKRRR